MFVPTVLRCDCDLDELSPGLSFVTCRGKSRPQGYSALNLYKTLRDKGPYRVPYVPLSGASCPTGTLAGWAPGVVVSVVWLG
jgi:hypothetical protein